MENLLLKKLQIKPGFKVSILNAPENASAIFGDSPLGIEFAYKQVPKSDAVLIFAHQKSEMMQTLSVVAKEISEQTICWILYPKAKSGIATDLNLMQSWDQLAKYNLNPCASAAINQVWTALRFKLIGTVKRSGLGNNEIQTNDYGEYIDVKNKTVNLPEDLNLELTKNNAALNFYEQLSYSNRKEYVLWILTAKQEKTRIDRIQKMIEKLLAGKKNPSDK